MWEVKKTKLHQVWNIYLYIYLHVLYCSLTNKDNSLFTKFYVLGFHLENITTILFSLNHSQSGQNKDTFLQRYWKGVMASRAIWEYGIYRRHYTFYI